ncbi:MAG: hypothetical protein BAJATHORv1_110051 [Candidatus Thorarchaeota archaeon]|nr:MAG: hypothetical protein BAJATHORv1_110051 [Candidatus Thorarchaeota archaeon]
MIIMAFSRIFRGGDKELRKQADDLMLKISKALQAASAKLHQSAQAWFEGDLDLLLAREEEIITIERSADEMKDELVESIFSQHAYLPQQTQERHKLVEMMDDIVDAAEEAVRMMAIGRKSKPPEELVQITEKCWNSTDLLQDAVKFLFKDFSKSVEFCHRVEDVREEARDIQFDLMGQLLTEKEYPPSELLLFHGMSHRILLVAERTEATADYIRALATKYS